jgi:Uma2 family endonuclease
MRSEEKNKKFSLEDYLAYDDAREGRSEFYDGEIFDMAGGSYVHGVICSNISGALFNALKGTGCRPNDSGVKVHIHASKSISYPDLSVVYGETEYFWPRLDIIKNPTVIIEVLSPSTEGFDRGSKFRKYKQLKSLREYVLVEQESANVDVFYLNDDGEWVNDTYAGLEGEMVLRSLGVNLALMDVYRDVGFGIPE